LPIFCVLGQGPFLACGNVSNTASMGRTYQWGRLAYLSHHRHPYVWLRRHQSHRPGRSHHHENARPGAVDRRAARGMVCGRGRGCTGAACPQRAAEWRRLFPDLSSASGTKDIDQLAMFVIPPKFSFNGGRAIYNLWRVDLRLSIAFQHAYSRTIQVSPELRGSRPKARPDRASETVRAAVASVTSEPSRVTNGRHSVQPVATSTIVSVWMNEPATDVPRHVPPCRPRRSPAAGYSSR
jgi:hypothetical protein